MAEVNVPYSEAGLAAFQELDSYVTEFLISGSWPALAPGYPLPMAASQTFKQFEVLGLDGNNQLVPAEYGVTQAQFVCTQAVTSGAGENPTVDVFYAGCFNPDALVWGASYDNDEKKRSAFEGAPTPTQILIRARQS